MTKSKLVGFTFINYDVPKKKKKMAGVFLCKCKLVICRAVRTNLISKSYPVSNLIGNIFRSSGTVLLVLQAQTSQGGYVGVTLNTHMNKKQLSKKS